MALFNLADWAVPPDSENEKNAPCGGKPKAGSCGGSCGGGHKKDPDGKPASCAGPCGGKKGPCGGEKKSSCGAEKKGDKKGPCSPGSCSPGSCVGAPKKDGADKK